MTNRRKRLYGAALLREVLPSMAAECDAIEAYADRRISYAAFRAAHTAALHRHAVDAVSQRDSADKKRLAWLLGEIFHREAEHARAETYWHLRYLNYSDTDELTRGVDKARDAVDRCFTGIALPAVPAEYVTADVRKLAEAIYSDKDFAAMPILADALEDAGVHPETSLMHHCRRDAKHWRGCCVLDSILGRMDK